MRAACPASSAHPDEKTRIKSICFDRHERPAKAVIFTRLGVVEVVWRNVCGDRCWFTSGTLDAKKLANCAIEKIERMLQPIT